MAAYFFDSSAVVKRYVHEMGTAWVLSVTAPTAGHFIYIAHITGVEVVSAIPATRITVLCHPLISAVRQPGGGLSSACETSF